MHRLYITISASILTLAAAIAVIALWRRKGVDPVKGTVSSKYGVRSGGFHNGTDIAVPVGTAVKSPWRGTVIDTYSNAQGGLQMIIDHPNGYRTGYAHLSATVAKKRRPCEPWPDCGQERQHRPFHRSPPAFHAPQGWRKD